VAFKTPMVSKKTPSSLSNVYLLSQLSHQFNHLVSLHHTGTMVAQGRYANVLKTTLPTVTKLIGSLLETQKGIISMEQARNIAQHTFVLIPVLLVATLALEPVALAVTPRWIPTGSLNIPRSGFAHQAGHTATLLQNGKVLVVGGDASGLAELYDPTTGAWSFTDRLNRPRWFHTATLLPDGKVLVAGGTTASESAEVYDPATESWSITGSLNTGRDGHTATLLRDGKVLVAGGFTGFSRGGLCPCIDFVTNSAEIYDPAMGTWSVTGNLNTERGLHTGTLLQNGKILAAGGTDGTLTDIAEYVPFNSAEVFPS
jgi:Kelch motif